MGSGGASQRRRFTAAQTLRLLDCQGNPCPLSDNDFPFKETTTGDKTLSCLAFDLSTHRIFF